MGIVKWYPKAEARVQLGVHMFSQPPVGADLVMLIPQVMFTNVVLLLLFVLISLGHVLWSMTF